jgi:hypothetical protein
MSTRSDDLVRITTGLCVRGDSISSLHGLVEFVVEMGDWEYESLIACFCTPTLYLGADIMFDFRLDLASLDARDLWNVLDRVDWITESVCTNSGLRAGMEPQATTHRSSMRLHEYTSTL